MGLKQVHKQKFKMKSTYITNKRGRLVQVECKWCNEFNEITSRTSFTQLATFKRRYYSTSYNILCDFMWGLHPNDIFSQDSQVGVPKLVFLLS